MAAVSFPCATGPMACKLDWEDADRWDQGSQALWPEVVFTR